MAGLNCTVSVRDCPGDNFAGNVPPDTENPVPCTEAELTSRGQVPTDFNVTNWVAAVFTGTVPKATLVVLTLIVDTTPVRVMTYVVVTPAELALKVAFCVDPTADALAVKPALVAPAGTVTVAGTATAALLLDRPTLSPPVGAGAFRFTVHALFANPDTDALLHESELTAADAVLAPKSAKRQMQISKMVGCIRP
jgi:hypothetical protein